jgi:hypothetical protein
MYSVVMTPLAVYVYYKYSRCENAPATLRIVSLPCCVAVVITRGKALISELVMIELLTGVDLSTMISGRTALLADND